MSFDGSFDSLRLDADITLRDGGGIPKVNL